MPILWLRRVFFPAKELCGSSQNLLLINRLPPIRNPRNKKFAHDSGLELSLEVHV